MNVIKNRVFVLKSIKKDMTLQTKTLLKSCLNKKTFIISGGTRGIGYEIGKKLALEGSNVALFGKTTIPYPKLDRTIYSAAESICDLTKKSNCIGIECDVRVPEQIDFALREVISRFGGIHGLVLNESAELLNITKNQRLNEINLMTDVNIKGTFLLGQKCLQDFFFSRNGHILIISPPLKMIDSDEWWINHFYYSMSKYNMSLMAKYWNIEFPNVAVNTLWPRTTIDTTQIININGDEKIVNLSRSPEIMGEAAKYILASYGELCNGKNFIDDEVLASVDIDIEQFKINKSINEKDLMPNLFC